MKLNAKSKIIILIALGILFAIVPMIFVNPSLITDSNNVINLDNENLKISAVSGKIHIINNSGWIDFRNAGNCTGNGTYSDPYVIEDLVIDGGGSGSCILIENSDVYFKIENCTVYDSGDIWGDAGIKLLGVSNGTLISNNASINYSGIFLKYSNYITISGNIASNNIYHGMVLEDSNYNNISGNIACNNTWDGIRLSLSDNNTISENTISSNNLGITLRFSNKNTILKNIAHHNEGGIVLWDGANNYEVSGNLVFRERWTGIGFHSAHYNNVSNNHVFECNSGIVLYEFSDHNIITWNELHNNFVEGIILKYNDNYNNVSNNLIYRNLIGIFINSSSNYNTISGNTVNDNWDGINLISCNYNTISGNTANDNWRGINLISCNYNTISGNIVNNNHFGIYFYNCINNTVSGNTVKDNNEGIFLWASSYITISGNNMTRCGINPLGPLVEHTSSHKIDTTNLVNSKPVYYYANEISLGTYNFTYAGDTGQVILANCSNSNVSNLNLSYGVVGISLLYSDNNTVSGNNATNNVYGIWIRNSVDNTVSGNTANNNIYHGILVEYSNATTISGNIVNNNGYGIRLSICNNITVSGNTANNNIKDGILVEYSNATTISRNTANFNENGIILDGSNNNNISGNTANYNRYGILLYESDNNTVSGNRLIGNQECIIEVNCQGNVIQDNVCTLPPSLNYFLIILIISITIIGVAVFVIYKNHKRFRKPQEDLEFL